MVDFGTSYSTPMDQDYHGTFKQADKRSDVEGEPIFPIHMIGTTVPENDPTGRNKNIVEGVDAAFRGGAGNIQLVMQVPGQTSGMGGGPKAYGEEVREAIREVQRASGGKITGIELPTQINNLSGFTQQGFSEEQRQTALDEVRDSIKFVGDIAGGGGVDIVSWEFPRNFEDADWWKKDTPFKQRGEEQILIVNRDTGQLAAPFKKDQDQFMNIDPTTFKETPNKTHRWEWGDFQNWSKKEGKDPGVLWIQHRVDTQLNRLKGEESRAVYRNQEIDQRLRLLKQRGELNEEEKKEKDILTGVHEGAQQELQAIQEQKRELEEEKGRYKPVDEFALNKSTDSYAQAGIWALQETEKNEYVRKGKGEVHVGPEMGWPQYYGSHPTEWVNLILESRRKMADRLVEEDSYSESEAKKLAKEHIKGMVDTSHLGMWFQSFKPSLPWDERITQFKKWYKGQMEYLAEQNKEHDIIGGIQVVDSATGAHGHLPPGEGILGKDIFEYMKILKEKGGYKGELTSEGHEEEKFGQGRILTKAWETFGSTISNNYWSGGQVAPSFTDIRQSYAGQAYGTTGIFRGYVPSNDFSLWSEVPFE